MSDVTKTITVKQATHAKLESLGKKGQSFDEIINELLQDKTEALA